MNFLDFLTGGADFNDAGLPPNALPYSGEGVPLPAPRPPGADMAMPPNGVPMPAPRPMEAGPSAADLGMTSAPADLAMSPGPPPRGAVGSRLIEAIFGPDAARSFDQQGGMPKLAASLAGGLNNMKGQPFAGQAFGNSMGGALEGGNKWEDNDYTQKLQALDRALKNKQIDQRADAADDLADYRSGTLGVRRQQVNQTGAYQQGRLALGERGVAVKEGEAPSRIALNNSRVDLNGARIAGQDRTSLMQADSQADRWRAETGKTLRQARQSIMQDYSLRPEQKQAQLSTIDQKLQDADNQYFKMKQENRAARGLDADGKPLPKQGKQSAAPRAANPGEISMQGNGTRQAPYQPQAETDFADMPSGTHYIDPGDGKLYVKD